MAAVNKIDSNTVGVRYSKETSPKVADGSAVWYPLDPNTVSDFGGTITTVARSPMNVDRQRRKGAMTDMEAAGKIGHDLVQAGLQDILQGFFFADLRDKGTHITITSIDDDPRQYLAASGMDVFDVNDLVYVTGCASSTNNGLKTVTASAAGSITVSEVTVADAAPTNCKIVKVGHQFAAGDVHVDVTGDLPELHTTAKNLTQLDLVPGEYIYIGGDAAATKFAAAADSGMARVRSIAANVIILDKTEAVFTIDDGATKTIQIFFGRVLKNETGDDVVRKTYQIERNLGAPDDAAPTTYQYEYLTGAVPDQLTVNIPGQNIVTMDMGFVAMGVEYVAAGSSAKAGTRPALVDESAFDTSNNVARINMAAVSSTNEAPTPLFAYVTEGKIDVKNNIKPNKAIGVVGAFDASAGNFEVSGTITAYFTNVSGPTAVTNFTDVTLDIHLLKDNSGISIDLPLVNLGNGKINQAKDAPITLDLSHDAVSGAHVYADLDHTMLMVFWDYLPTVAMP